MSKYELRKTIKKELRELNWKIDMKIVRGLPYRTDARRHKILLMQLDRLSRRASEGLAGGLVSGFSGGLLGKMAGAFASFVL